MATWRDYARAEKAKQLARLAEQRRPDGSRGLRARRALRTLLAMAGHDDGLPAVFDAFMDPHRVFGARQDYAAVRFPADGSAERAFLYLYTGRLAEYEALDPDGSLIAMAYWVATEHTQDVLRQALVAAGKLHVVRALATAGPRRGVEDMSIDEIGDLARLLAEHGEWAQLWRLVRDSPVAAAVAAMPRFGDWRPAAAADAELFDRLAAIAPEAVASVVARAVRVFGKGWYGEASFAPDLSELAAGGEKSITVFRMADGQPVTTYGERALYSNLLHLGDRTVVYSRSRRHGSEAVRRTPDGSAHTLATDSYYPLPGLARTPSGYVLATWKDLLLGTATGDPGHAVPFRSLGAQMWAGLLASDPVAGRIAVVGRRDKRCLLVLLDADLTPLARTTLDDLPAGIRVCGPDLVLAWGQERGSLRSWRRDGDVLAAAAQESTDYADRVRMVQGVPIRRNVNVLRWFDPATLEEVAGPSGFRSSGDPAPALSLDGHHTAASRREPPWSGLEVRDVRLSELVELARHPITTATPGLLETANRLARHDLDDEAAALLRVVTACLEYRFSGDVVLGTTTTVAGEDDIALGDA